MNFTILCGACFAYSARKIAGVGRAPHITRTCRVKKAAAAKI